MKQSTDNQSAYEQVLSSANGENIVSFVPENSRAIAIVDLKVLKKLVKQLPSVPLTTIKNALANEILDTDTLNELMELLEDEIAFHKSVNDIQEFSAPKDDNGSREVSLAAELSRL